MKFIDKIEACSRFKEKALKYSGSFTGEAYEDAAKMLFEMEDADVRKHEIGSWSNGFKINLKQCIRNCDVLIQIRCSRCGRLATKFSEHIPYRFCPHCGAEMEGVYEWTEDNTD